MGLLMDLFRERELTAAEALKAAVEECLRQDWKGIVEELARVIAPVADEVELTESFRGYGETRFFRCAWLVQPKPEMPIRGSFELVFEAATGWYLVDGNSRRAYLIQWPAREPNWDSIEVREFLKRVLVPVEVTNPAIQSRGRDDA